MTRPGRHMAMACVLLGVCAALVLAACGGDDEEFTLPTTTTTAGATGGTGATGATGEDGAAGGSGDAVEEALTEAGFGIASVDCPDDVPLEEGDSFECDFSMESGSSGTLSINVETADDQSATISYLGEAGEDSVEGEGVEVQK